MSTDRELLVSLQAQIAAQLGTVVKPPVDPPPPPPPPTGDNPFFAWFSDGWALNDVHDYKLHRGTPRSLTNEQWVQAIAAGYKRSDLTPSSGGGPSRPIDDLTGYEDGDFIPSRQFPSSAVRWTSNVTKRVKFVLVEETHPSSARTLSAVVTDNLGNGVALVGAGNPIPATVDVSFDAVFGRTYFLTVSPDATIFRHVEMRTR